MAHHGPEIAVVVEQGYAMLDAPSSDQHVDGLPDGNVASAQRPEIAGGLDRIGVADHGRYIETAQQTLLSTTITPPRFLCGCGRDCRSSDTCQRRHRPRAGAAT